MTCELCDSAGGAVLWRDSSLRVARVDDKDYPGFCRVIWHAHVKEMTDLSVEERNHVLRAVFAVETAIRAIIKPDKINLASLGNMTPHVHWHVIPRFVEDRHYPHPIWAPPVRTAPIRKMDVQQFDRQMTAALQQALQ
jgi:diadenosine tetraphosphate (Ap4A) HIT family hydrolase